MHTPNTYSVIHQWLQTFMYKAFLHEKIIISKTEVNINNNNIILTIPYYALNKTKVQTNKPVNRGLKKNNWSSPFLSSEKGNDTIIKKQSK